MDGWETSIRNKRTNERTNDTCEGKGREGRASKAGRQAAGKVATDLRHARIIANQPSRTMDVDKYS